MVGGRPPRVYPCYSGLSETDGLTAMYTESAPRTRVPFGKYASLLWTYLRPQKALAAAVGVLLLGNIGLQLLGPQILRYFIDEALGGSPVVRLIWIAVLFTGVALFQQAVNVVTTYASGRVGWTATNALRGDLARHCMKLDMSFHNRRTPGEMIERIDGDAEELGGFFSTFVIHILGSTILLAGILVLLFREEWRAGLVLTVFALLVLVALYSLRNLTVDRFRAVREASAQTFGFIEERLAGREDIRTSGARPYVMLGFHSRIRDWFRKNLIASLMISLVLNTTWFSFAVGNAVALGVGAWLFLNDLVTIGTVYLVVHYTRMLLEPMERFTQQLNNLQRATASLIRILDLLETKPRILDGPGARFPDGALPVRFEDVSFSYNPDEPVLHDISFELAPGRALGLVGRTGSGKTTITRLLFRLYDPDRGRVLLGGEDVRDAQISQLRGQVGVVTQDVRLFEGTVRDNLTLLDHTIPDERMIEVVKELGLGSWYADLPHGLDTVVRSEGAGMSAGEAQLLAFARVFLRDPRVVVLDEASSRIDPGTERLIEQAVDRLVEGRTVIVIAHRLSTLDRCDEVMVLEQGRIVEHGQRERLAAAPGSRFHQMLTVDDGEMLA